MRMANISNIYIRKKFKNYPDTNKHLYICKKNYFMYPEAMVSPMKKELTSKNFKELLTATDVDSAIKQSGVTLIFVNSVCGCAAGSARPGVVLSLLGAKSPNHLATVFAGVDKDSVAQVRKYLLPYPPSSPSIALFKDGKLVHFIERHQIEGRSAEMLAEHLKEVYNQYC